MAVFADESGVRLRTQLTDTDAVSSVLVVRCIEDAHAVLLGYLRAEFDVAEPPETLVLGETLLAGAYVLRALSSGSTDSLFGVALGGQRHDGRARRAGLLAQAASVESSAWSLLAPFLVSVPGRAPLGASATEPVLSD